MSTNDYISTRAMDRMFGHDIKQFQLETISRVLAMGTGDVPHEPLLLVQGTGGGKSSIYQIIGAIKAGVTIIIESTLSLSSDQYSKIGTICDNSNLHCFQLDAIKRQANITRIFDLIRNY